MELEQEPQQQQPRQKRRGKSIATKLDAALHDAEVLHRTAKKPYTDGLIWKMRLVHVRTETLRQLLSRKHAEKVERLESEIAKLSALVSNLKSENQRLASELAAARAPKVAPQIERAHAALAKYESERQAERQQGGTQ